MYNFPPDTKQLYVPNKLKAICTWPAICFLSIRHGSCKVQDQKIIFHDAYVSGEHLGALCFHEFSYIRNSLFMW